MGSPERKVNAAVAANLEKVLAGEQHASAQRLAKLRLGLAAIIGLVAWSPRQEHADVILPTRIGVLVFFGLAAVVFLVARRSERWARWSAFSVPFIDVPAVAAIQFVQQELLPAKWMSVPSNVGIMCGLVALSTLSLSRRVILSTGVTALMGLWLVTGRSGVAPHPIVLTSVMLAGIAAIGVAVEMRVRRLVHQAREKDLVGKYILGDRLGAGGMAEVFLATYSPEGGFERRVAVKRILPSYAESAESVALFRREAELGALLAHPNIVQVLDFGSDGAGYFIAMEYVDGTSLGKLLTFCRRAQEVVPLEVCVHVAWMMAEALDYMHTRPSPTGTPLKLVHRDVNPPNVLVSRIGEVKLGDFGIARATTGESLTAAGVLRGKMGYSAPEQLLDQPYDGRADLFALGVSLHELICSRRLFTGDSELAQFRACLEGPIPLPSSVRPDVPPALERIVMRLLERDVAQRTQTARDVVEALRALPPQLTDHAHARRALSALVARALDAPSALTSASEGSGKSAVATPAEDAAPRTATGKVPRPAPEAPGPEAMTEPAGQRPPRS